MANLKTMELKAFVPAKGYEVLKRFYQDVGFELKSDGDGVAYFCRGDASFLLQNFYVKEFAENLMLHLLVEDVDAWWAKLDEAGIAEQYGVKMLRAQLQPWRMRDFTLLDPSESCGGLGRTSLELRSERRILFGNDEQEGKANERGNKQQQVQKQIPCGNDKQEGMTNRGNDK